MGTHPIFESDFDCLTEKMTELEQKFDLLPMRRKNDIRKLLKREVGRRIRNSQWKKAKNIFPNLFQNGLWMSVGFIALIIWNALKMNLAKIIITMLNSRFQLDKNQSL